MRTIAARKVGLTLHAASLSARKELDNRETGQPILEVKYNTISRQINGEPSHLSDHPHVQSSIAAAEGVVLIGTSCSGASPEISL
jgi:hypothetical protein